MTTRTNKPAKSKAKSPNAKARTTISLPPEILTAGVQRADKVRRNFSNYIEALIDRDVRLQTLNTTTPVAAGTERP